MAYPLQKLERQTSAPAGSPLAERLRDHPLALLLGGVAIGIAIGVLLPRARRGIPVPGMIGGRARAIAPNAVELIGSMGRAALDELGIDREHALHAARPLIDGLVSAAGSAGSALLNRTGASLDKKG